MQPSHTDSAVSLVGVARSCGIEAALDIADENALAEFARRVQRKEMTLFARVAILAEERSQVFTAFYRGGEDAARSSAGAGLGLAVSRAIVEAHGGRIWLAEAAGGTSVRFTLPAAGDALKDFPAARSSASADR